MSGSGECVLALTPCAGMPGWQLSRVRDRDLHGRGYLPPMAVFALWSAPRARSTAFFRSMAERGDMILLHEPFSNLRDYGETDVDGRVFRSSASLLAWLREEMRNVNVFFKDTADHPFDEVLADRRFLAGTRHAFLIRRPEEIAASYYALFPPMTINAIGMERLCGLQAAVRDAGGTPHRRSARWHIDASASSGFERREHTYQHTAENSAKLARYAAHHRPFYDDLYARRLNVKPWEPPAAADHQQTDKL
jgi:hypothetical protein